MAEQKVLHLEVGKAEVKVYSTAEPLVDKKVVERAENSAVLRV